MDKTLLPFFFNDYYDVYYNGDLIKHLIEMKLDYPSLIIISYINEDGIIETIKGYTEEFKIIKK